jgi:glycosyltransferase involved in cell wall biosynthesis
LIKGVGVNLSEMNYCPPKSKSKLEVIFLGRLLKDKGLLEFISAANQLKPKYQNQVVFRVYGGLDLENRMAISESELKLHLDSDCIVWEGFTQNVHLAYSEADIVVFPSYREGLPKSLIEAMAIGRPIITTDVPGCRECVVDEYNGFLVPLKEVDPIVIAIEKLINNEQLRVNMGENARKFCETHFNVNEVIQAHKTIYNNLDPI